MNTEKGPIIILCLISLAFSGRSHAEAQPEAVGPFGEVGTIVFEGNDSYTEKDLQDELRTYSGFIVAAHPEAPLASLPEQISGAIERGYLAGGFPEVKVSAVMNAKRGGVDVRIVEGVRIMNGVIQITGLNESLEKTLRTRLQDGIPKVMADPGVEYRHKVSADPSTDAEENKFEFPYWPPGEPTKFHGGAEPVYMKKKVRQVLSENGRFRPEVDVRIVTGKDGLAELQVEVSHLGPKAVVDEIEVEGAKRDTRQDIMEYLGITENMEMDGSLLEQWRDSLYQSGRHLKSDVSMVRTAADSDKINIHISVVEFDRAPPLREPLTREQRTYIKFANWLNHLGDTADDLVLEATHAEKGRFQGVLSPTKGMLFALRLFREAGQTDRAGADLFFQLSPGEFMLQFGGMDDYLQLGELAMPVEGFMKMGASDPPNQEKPFQYEFGVGFGSQAKSKNALPFKISVDPVVFAVGFEEVVDSKLETSWEGGQLCMTGKKGSTQVRVVLDEVTGRLIEITSEEDEIRTTLRTEVGGFERIKKDIALAEAEAGNRYDAEAPVSSVLSYLLGALEHYALHANELSEWAESLQAKVESKTEDAQEPSAESERPEMTAEELQELQDVAQALHQLLDLGMLKPLDALVKELSGDPEVSESEFSIPFSPEDFLAENPLLLIIAEVLLEAIPVLPEDSWLEVFAGEMIQVAYGNHRYTRRVMDGLHDDTEHIGPVGYWAMSMLLGMMQNPEADRFARQGLEQLGVEGFSRDWMLFAGHPSVELAFEEFLDALPKLKKAEREVLARVLGEDGVEKLDELIEQAGEAKKKGFAKALDPAMKQLWEESVRGAMEKGLLKITGGAEFDPERYSVVVNGEPLHRGLIEHHVHRQAARLNRVQQNELRSRLLQQAIFQELLYQEYRDHLEERYPGLPEDLFKKQFADQANGSETALRQQGYPIEAIKKELLMPELLNRLVAEQIPHPSEDALRARYKQLSNDESVALHMIYIPVKPKDPILTPADQLTKMKSIRKDLDEGANFVELAKKYSAGPAAERGGYMGMVKLSNLYPEIQEAIRKVPMNVVSEVVKTHGSLFLVKISDRRKLEGLAKNFEQARTALAEEMTAPARMKAAEEIMHRLRKKSKIVVLPKP